ALGLPPGFAPRPHPLIAPRPAPPSTSPPPLITLLPSRPPRFPQQQLGGPLPPVQPTNTTSSTGIIGIEFTRASAIPLAQEAIKQSGMGLFIKVIEEVILFLSFFFLFSCFLVHYSFL
ncbi:MAG: hypothetical protein ACRD5B_19450, partial [Nitrososphaeraceae archaeon]